MKKQMSYVLFFCSKKAYQGSKVEKSHILQNKLSLMNKSWMMNGKNPQAADVKTISF